MSVPGFQEFMLPMLSFASDGKEHSLRESIEYLAEKLDISAEDRRDLLPSGSQSRFDNRVGWASFYLKKAKLLEATRRGCFKITKRGLDLLSKNPECIDIALLQGFDEFKEFVTARPKNDDTEHGSRDGIDLSDDKASTTPDEIIEAAYQKLRDSLADEVIRAVKNCSPSFFEQLVVDLLVKMGYGGSRKEAGQATKASGDEGIDGIIKEDRLGLDVIYLQAKRWDNQVSRPELQKFAGALQGQRARKGIFITTSSFTRGAIEFCENIDSKIILIDGEQLAKLMIDFNVGVSVNRTLEVKRIDSDYFDGES